MTNIYDNCENINDIINKYNLPENLKKRMLQDCLDNKYISRVETFTFTEPNSSYNEYKFLSWSCFGKLGIFVPNGSFGILLNEDNITFLNKGYHIAKYLGSEYIGCKALSSVIDKPFMYGSKGIINVSSEKILVVSIKSEYKILPYGLYEWDSSYVKIIDCVSFDTEQITNIGPYKLLSVFNGTVATTYNNGKLVILGIDDNIRTYFLDDPKWFVKGYISKSVQVTKLEGNDLLSKDNVELLMNAIAEWKIIDPEKAIIECGETMEIITNKVSQLFRATIARIVSGTNISSSSTGGVSQQIVIAQPVNFNEDISDLSHLMQSTVATKHMAELATNMNAMGIYVVGIYIPEKRMKNDDIRKQIANQAVIEIKALAERSSADASAYALIKGAEAKAQSEKMATIMKAEAEKEIAVLQSKRIIEIANAEATQITIKANSTAKSIIEIAKANAEADRMLPNSEGIGYKTMLAEHMKGVLNGAKLNIFSGNTPTSLINMLSETTK